MAGQNSLSFLLGKQNGVQGRVDDLTGFDTGHEATPVTIDHVRSINDSCTIGKVRGGEDHPWCGCAIGTGGVKAEVVMKTCLSHCLKTPSVTFLLSM